MKYYSIIGLAAWVLAGCGGGGGDSAVAPTSYPPEGMWQEPSLSLLTPVTLFVLDSGESWNLSSSSPGKLTRVVYGNTSTTGKNFTGRGRIFDVVQHTIKPVAYTGSVDPQKSIQFKLEGGESYSGIYASTYDQPASLMALGGSFNGSALTGETVPVAAQVIISQTGTVTMHVGIFCDATGTASPRVSGKNIFDINLEFSGAGCPLGDNSAVRGMAYYDAAQRQLAILAMNSAKTDGFVYNGLK